MTFSLHQGGVGSHVSSDYSRTVIKHSPLSPYTRHMYHLDVSSFTLFHNFSQRHPTLRQVISHQKSGGRSERTQESCKSGRMKHNHLHMHHGSPLIPIFRTLTASIHRHPYAAQGSRHHPSSKTSIIHPSSIQPNQPT